MLVNRLPAADEVRIREAVDQPQHAHGRTGQHKLVRQLESDDLLSRVQEDRLRRVEAEVGHERQRVLRREAGSVEARDRVELRLERGELRLARRREGRRDARSGRVRRARRAAADGASDPSDRQDRRRARGIRGKECSGFSKVGTRRTGGASSRLSYFFDPCQHFVVPERQFRDLRLRGPAGAAGVAIDARLQDVLDPGGIADEHEAHSVRAVVEAEEAAEADEDARFFDRLAHGGRHQVLARLRRDRRAK